jgi:hypothetical protein
MADQKHDPPGRGAGWVAAAIVAVVAVCAVSFMITQRPQEAMAVAEGDPLTGEMQNGQTPAHPTTPGDAPEAISVKPLDGADTGRIPPEPYIPPRTAIDANAAASNASAVEPAR